jgi:hypothetical protein
MPSGASAPVVGTITPITTSSAALAAPGNTAAHVIAAAQNENVLLNFMSSPLGSARCQLHLPDGLIGARGCAKW